MKPSLRYRSGSTKGSQRQDNKDRIQIIERDTYFLFIVFDGISSSLNAVQAIERVNDFILKSESVFLGPDHISLDQLMYEANRNLLSLNIEGGVTTYALVYIDKREPTEIFFSNLGDTRIYEINKQALTALTTDHNLAGSPNVVTKYLGMTEYGIADFFVSKRSISVGEKLLICSDGFYEALEENPLKLHKILNFKKIGNIERNFEKTILKKNTDDASYILIETSYV